MRMIYQIRLPVNLKQLNKEERLNKYKALLKFRNIPFEADLFTWHNDEI